MFLKDHDLRPPVCVIVRVFPPIERWEEAADLIDAMRGNDQEDDDELADILLLLDEERTDTPPSSPPASAEERPKPPLASNHSPTATAKGGSPDGVEFRVASPSSFFSPPPPDVRSYNSCIAACRRGGQSGLAKLFFHDMLSRGLRPDVWTFKSAVLDRVQAQPPTPPAPAATATATAAKAGIRQIQENSSRPDVSGGQERLPPSRAPQQARSPWRALLVLLEEVDGEGLGPDPPCIILALTECARAGRWEVRGPSSCGCL